MGFNSPIHSQRFGAISCQWKAVQILQYLETAQGGKQFRIAEPAYCVGNAGASYTRGDWTLSLRGTNVTDARYMQRAILSTLSSKAQRFYVPAPGIGVSAGLTWRWSAGDEIGRAHV